MRLYRSDGKIFVELNETIELCGEHLNDTLQTYKDMLVKRVSDRFDWTVAEAALRGMEQSSKGD